MQRPRKSFALWLMPTGDLYDRLAGTIRGLSREFSTPSFEPHITLLSGIVGSEREVLSKTAALAGLLRPFKVRLTEIGWLEEYFRCLFVHAVATAPLLKAHQTARGVFGLRERPEFMPHLSLTYGNLPARAKEEIAARLGRRLDVEFRVRRLDLYVIRGEPRDWRCLRRFSL